MKFPYNNIILLFFLNAVCFCKKNIFPNLEKFTVKNIHIKVLLSEIELNNKEIQWSISSTKGIILKDRINKKIVNKNLTFKSFNNSFYINNKKITQKLLKLDAHTGYIKFNNNEYHGSFFIVKEKDILQLINKVELEDYTFSVLKTESWPGWPLEVNKVFAIATRTYVISKFLENRQKNQNYYHIKNTNKHQTYSGTHNSQIIKQAVEETKDIILGFNKKPILAMFDACCGGIIPANMIGVNFNSSPYLKRKQQCTFCKNCKLFSWTIEYKKNDFEKILKNEFINLKNLQSIKLNKDKAGIVHNIEIKDKKSKYHSTGKKFYSMIPKIKSFCFSIKKEFEKIIINGKGYGHHLGICQWGAREMVNKDWDYKSILQFYYPGSNLMKLSKK